MVRAAVLASGDGARLQAILDAVYFNEIPNFELVAVLCPQRDCYAVSRAHGFQSWRITVKTWPG